jgi:hypothetical protein
MSILCTKLVFFIKIVFEITSIETLIPLKTFIDDKIYARIICKSLGFYTVNITNDLYSA